MEGKGINIIDTPGHVDFAGEVERSLSVLDGAVLVLSAAEGIQAHTEVLWDALRSLKIPTLLFVNKIDRAGCDLQNLLARCACTKSFPPYSSHGTGGGGGEP